MVFDGASYDRAHVSVIQHKRLTYESNSFGARAGAL